jgi:acetyl-CoA acetyltransferase
MLQTAENVARKHSIDTREQHEVVLRRLEQYSAALENDRAFQRRFMSLPFEVPRRDLKKMDRTLDGDEGIFESTAEGLARLKPVIPGGTVTFGGQTHPSDGNAAIIVANRDTAAQMSRDRAIRIELCCFGQARAELGYMPEATVPAALAALKRAQVDVKDLAAVKTHNPFALNDIVFSRAVGFPLERMNNYGCSLVWGHPNGPTALRSVIELIEELVLRGGGFGLFAGCAAGDSAMAVVIKVGPRASA